LLPDLPPINRTSHFSKKSINPENNGRRTSKYSEEQIIGFLRQAEAGMPIKELGRKHVFSDASFYKWRSKYGSMDASEAKRLRELELENGKLKRLPAEAHLDIHALKSVFGTRR
jgi:putative transposase